MSYPTVTNAEFLQACFGGDWQDAHVTGFAEPPDKLESLGLKHYWMGAPWRELGKPHSRSWDGLNSFFTISLFSGKRRVKAEFRSTHVIVIDDVGTKVKDVAWLPAPSWRLETSPGNFQWGYILAAPETDAGRVTTLVDGLIKGGLTPDSKDPGMRGVTRYVRLPVGRNNKTAYGPAGWSHVLREWNPGLRWSMDELAAAFRLPALPAPGTAPTGVAGQVSIAADRDEIFYWMSEWGLMQGGRAADGKGYLITCPWIEGHTGRVDTGTAYWLGGGFECHHGHCADRGRRELEVWVDARLQAEHAGKRLGVLDFDVVPGYVAPYHAPDDGFVAGAAAVLQDGSGAGPAVVPDIAFGQGVAGEFFRTWIYVGREDAFYSTDDGGLFTGGAVDRLWHAALAGAGALPLVGRGGALMRPCEWYFDAGNAGRARLATQVTYWPGQVAFFEEAGATYVNRWRPGPRLSRPFEVQDDEVRPWLTLVDHIVGHEGPDAVGWVLDWMAHVVAQPGVKPGWHLVLRAGQGVGKDMMMQPVIHGVGPDNHATANADSLRSGFNPWAEKRLIGVNELHAQGLGRGVGQSQYNKLKELTENTNKLVTINQKNMKEYRARNTAAFYITSNDEQAVALAADDRRFLVVNSSEVQKIPGSFYANLAEWMAGPGKGLCSEWLWERWEAMDAGRRELILRNAPGTAGKLQMVRDTEDELTGWVREQIEDGIWPDLMTADDMVGACAAAGKNGVAVLRNGVSPKRLGGVLRELGADKVYGGSVVRLKSGKSARLWATREPSRFVNMGEAAIAQAYISAAGHDFTDGDDDKIVKLT